MSKTPTDKSARAARVWTLEPHYIHGWEVTGDYPPCEPNDPKVKVIDYEAYQSLLAERDELKSYVERMRLSVSQESYGKLLAEHDELWRQAEALAAALEVYAMTNETFPEYGTVAHEALRKFRGRE